MFRANESNRNRNTLNPYDAFSRNSFLNHDAQMHVDGTPEKFPLLQEIPVSEVGTKLSACPFRAGSEAQNFARDIGITPHVWSALRSFHAAAGKSRLAMSRDLSARDFQGARWGLDGGMLPENPRGDSTAEAEGRGSAGIVPCASLQKIPHRQVGLYHEVSWFCLQVTFGMSIPRSCLFGKYNRSHTVRSRGNRDLTHVRTLLIAIGGTATNYQRLLAAAQSRPEAWYLVLDARWHSSAGAQQHEIFRPRRVCRLDG